MNTPYHYAVAYAEQLKKDDEMKQEPKPDVVSYFFLDESNHLWSSTSDGGNLKIIRDGNGKLKSAEVLK